MSRRVAITAPRRRRAGARPSPEGRARRRRRTWAATPSNRTAALLMAPLALGVGLFVAYPIVKLGIDSVSTGNGLQNYSDALSSRVVRRAMLSTIAYSAVVTVFAVAIGWGFAWTIRTARSRLVRGVVWAAVLLPFWMGVVVKNYAFTVLLASNGIVNRAIVALGLSDKPVQLLYTKGAVIAGILYAMVPYAVLATYAVLSSIDLALVRAAESLGATRTRSIATVVVPLAVPGIVAAAAIVFAVSIGFYVTPLVLGGAQTPFAASLIQADIFTYANQPEATTAAMLLLVTAFVVLAAAFRLVGRERLLRAIA